MGLNWKIVLAVLLCVSVFAGVAAVVSPYHTQASREILQLGNPKLPVLGDGSLQTSMPIDNPCGMPIDNPGGG
jgi:hypothetical protein